MKSKQQLILLMGSIVAHLLLRFDSVSHLPYPLLPRGVGEVETF